MSSIILNRIDLYFKTGSLTEGGQAGFFMVGGGENCEFARLSVCLDVSLSGSLHVYLYVLLPDCLEVCLSIWISIWVSI